MTGGNVSAGKLIFWLDELCKEHSNLVGKKCANLGELTKAGFQVPPGFALCLEAYEEFLTTTGTIDGIRQYFATFNADPSNPKDMPKYTEASKAVRSIVESKAMPKNIEDSVARYYDGLCQKTGIKDVAVAIRSAGPVSHPGQYETYLNVTGMSSVMDNIVRVWSSTFNTRSLIARARKGLSLEYDPIGVAVLKMVRAKAAGIMFTAEPTTADSSKLVIEGTWGLGESVVSGVIIPDCWVVGKTTLEIIERKVSPKPAEHKLHPETGKASSFDITHDRQELCLSDEEVIELTKTGKRIEQCFGSPQDIEWAVDSELPNNNIVILQTRPEHFRISFAGF
jgi:pyruvate,water dikinase